MDNISMNSQVIIAVSASLFTVLFGIGLILWHRKYKKQISVIEKIGDGLVRQGASLSFAPSPEVPMEEDQAKITSQQKPFEERAKDTHEEIKEPKLLQPEAEKRDNISDTKSGEDNIGLSGKVYTREELIAQIRK